MNYAPNVKRIADVLTEYMEHHQGFVPKDRASPSALPL
jgi:hypothetical protein